MTELTTQSADGIRTRRQEVAGWLRRRLHAIARERRARRITADLRQYSDHLLRDIGIARDQIELAVRDGLGQRETPRWRV